MLLEVRLALRVPNASIVHADVTEGGAVLGQVDRRDVVVVPEPHEEVEQPFRRDLPTHVRIDRVRLADRPRAVAVLTSGDDLTPVVVDAEEVDRHPDQCEVSFLGRRSAVPEVFEGDQPVAAAEQRVEEPPVVEPVEVAGRLTVALVAGRRVHREEIERDPDPGSGRLAAEDLHPPAVRDEQMMGGQSASRSLVRPGAWIPQP